VANEFFYNDMRSICDPMPWYEELDCHLAHDGVTIWPGPFGEPALGAREEKDAIEEG